MGGLSRFASDLCSKQHYRSDIAAQFPTQTAFYNSTAASGVRYSVHPNFLRPNRIVCAARCPS